MWLGLRGHHFTAVQVLVDTFTERRLSQYESFWNRLPNSIVTAPFTNAIRHHVDSTWNDLFTNALWLTPIHVCTITTSNSPSYTILFIYIIIILYIIYRIPSLCGYEGHLWLPLPEEPLSTMYHYLLRLTKYDPTAAVATAMEIFYPLPSNMRKNKLTWSLLLKFNGTLFIWASLVSGKFRKLPNSSVRMHYSTRLFFAIPQHYLEKRIACKKTYEHCIT